MSNEKFEREFDDFLADETSRLAELYRKLPQQEPDVRLDAAIRAMAHRALNPQLVATPQVHVRRRSARWLPALGAAAGLVLAAGIAFRLGPSMRSDRSETGAPVSDVVSVRTLDAPAAAVPPLSPAPPPASAAAQATGGARASSRPSAPATAALPAETKARDAQEATAPTAVVVPEGSQSAAVGEIGKTQPPAPAPAEPKPFPEPPQRRGRLDEMDAVERKQIMAKGAWQNLHDQDASQAAKAKTAPGARDKASGVENESLEKRALSSEQDETSAPGLAPQPASGPAAKPMGSAAPAETTTAAPSAGNAAATSRPSTPAAALPDKAIAQGRESAARGEQPETVPAQAPATAETADSASALAGSAPQKKEDHVAPRSSDPNARLYPEHWLQNIRILLREQHREEALRSLAEFRKMYPTYHLPDDLRDLK